MLYMKQLPHNAMQLTVHLNSEARRLVMSRRASEVGKF